MAADTHARAVAIARTMLAGGIPADEGARLLTGELAGEAPDGLHAAAADWTLCPELRDALAADAMAGAREVVRRFAHGRAG